MEPKGKSSPRKEGTGHSQALPFTDSQVQLFLLFLLLALSRVPLQLKLHVGPSQSPRLLFQYLQLLLQLLPGLLQELSLPRTWSPEMSRNLGTSNPSRKQTSQGQRTEVSVSFKNLIFQGTWVAQSVKRPTSAQVMISRFVGSSRTSGFALMAWSLLRILCLPLSLLLPHSHSLSLSLSQQ